MGEQSSQRNPFLLKHSIMLLLVSSGCRTSLLDVLPVLAGCYCPSESCWSSVEWCPGGSAAGQTAWLQDRQTDKTDWALWCVICRFVSAPGLTDNRDKSNHKRYQIVFCTVFTCFCQCGRIRREIKQALLRRAEERQLKALRDRLVQRGWMINDFWALGIFDQYNLLSCVTNKKMITWYARIVHLFLPKAALCTQ